MKKATHHLYHTLCVLFAVVACIWGVNIVSLAASEETTGNWTYSYTTDGATITGYTGNDTTLKIPSSINGHKVIAIGRDVFTDSTMTEVTIPETVTSIESYAFYNCRKLSTIYFNAKSCADSYDSGRIFYKAGIDSNGIRVVFGSGVKRIPAYLFYINTSSDEEAYARVTAVEMSDSISVVGRNAFNNCYKLSTVTWGNSIETIGSSAFEDTAIKKVVISEKTTEIGSGAFYNTKKLSEITFKAKSCADSYSSGKVFYNAGAEADSLKVEFTSTVKEIPAYLFYCDEDYNYGDGTFAHVTSVKIANSVLVIGNNAFSNCYQLSDVTWGNSIETIGSSAFEDTAIKKAIISEKTTEIGSKAFYNTKKLSEITYKAKSYADSYSSGKVFYNAGAEAGSLKVEFTSTVKKIPAYLFYCYEDYNYGEGTYAHITSVKLSNSIETIETSAFERCFDLKTVTGGSSIKTIGSDSFANCLSLTEITLPKTLESVGSRAFEDCSKLKKVVVKSKKAEFSYYDVFTNCDKNLTIYCYRGSSAAEFAKNKGIRYKYLDLPAVSISRVANTSSGVKLSWKKVSSATGYYVYRKTGKKSYEKMATITNANKLSYVDSSVKSKNGTLYYYTVKAYNSKTSSNSYSSKPVFRLAGVNISKLKNNSGRKLYSTWGKNTKASGYQIQYATSSNFKKAKTSTISGYKNASRTITGLTKGKTYYVRVRAYKKSGKITSYSAWSGTKSVKISR